MWMSFCALFYTTLYSVSLGLITAAIIYSYFLQDSFHYVSKDKQVAMQEEKEAAEIKCDQGISESEKALPFLLNFPGVCCKLLKTVLRSFKAMVRVRPQRRNIWCFMLINIIATIAGGVGGITFMFYRLQYKIDTETFGWLMSAGHLAHFSLR